MLFLFVVPIYGRLDGERKQVYLRFNLVAVVVVVTKLALIWQTIKFVCLARIAIQTKTLDIHYTFTLGLAVGNSGHQWAKPQKLLTSQMTNSHFSVWTLNCKYKF